MAKYVWIVTLLTLYAAGVLAQQSGQRYDPAKDPTGMYSFLKEGEYVQLTYDEGQLSGYISRFGDSNSDRGQFIDQFFSKASLTGDRVTFATKTIHGVWYEFEGTLSTQAGRQPSQEGYRLMKGMLKEHVADANGRDNVRERSVEFKSFPEGVSQPR